MRYIEKSSRAVRAEGGRRGWFRLGLTGMFAAVLMTSGLIGGLTSVASASTSAFTLSMTSGVFGVHGNTPGALPTPASIAGHISSTTGNITGATLSIPTWHETNTGSSETITISESSPGTATGTLNYLGDMTYTDVLTIEVHITSPFTFKCFTKPVDITLDSSAPYNTSTHKVTLTESNFTIPHFTTCGLATSTLNSKFSGSSGNVLTLNVHGTLTEPAAPAATSTTSLSATPASPQLQGTSVTLKATVKKTTGALATTATGTMQFRKGTTVLATVAVSAGTASYVTTSLPAGTDKLTAAYLGGSAYKASTSSALTYVVEPAPTVVFTPASFSVTGGKATTTAFSVKITNPAAGVSWTHLYLTTQLAGIRNLKSADVTLQYEDTASAWCTFPGFRGTGAIVGTFVGNSTCSPTYPASFALAAGHSLTVNLRIAFPPATYSGYPFLGAEKVTGTLYTGTCSAATACTATSPLQGTAAPVGTTTVEVAPTTKLASRMKDIATRPGTSTVRKTFDVSLQSTVAPTHSTTITTGTTTTGLPAPTGTVTYKITGTTVVTSTVSIPIAVRGRTLRALYNSKTLSVAKHTLVATYSGDSVYTTSSLTETFTVTAAPSGTAFSCKIAGVGPATETAYVTASGTVPASAYDGSHATVTGISVTLNVDPADNAVYYNSSQSAATLGFGPSGTNATKGPITFTGTTGTASVIVGTWTGATSSVLVTGAVGSKVTVRSNLIEFTAGFSGWTCTPVTTGAAIGTITVAAPPTPVTWTLAGCTSGSTTAPSWANTEKVVAKGAGGGGGGAAASATGYGGRGGAGGSATTTFTIAGSTAVSAKTGCAGKGAPQGGGVVGNGGAAVSGWSSSGAGGQGTYCWYGTPFGTCGLNDGTGASGGGSTGVCNGASTCTSATTTHVVTVAAGGGGGGESMCSGTDAGNGGIAGNSTTTATSGTKGKGPSGTTGTNGAAWAITGAGVKGGPGGANNKSTGSGSAAGSAGGSGGAHNSYGDSGASGGGGAGYIGGSGGAANVNDADCSMGGGGGGGASWVATAGGTTSFGTGAAGSNRSGSTGSAGSVTVTFSYTPAR